MHGEPSPPGILPAPRGHKGRHRRPVVEERPLPRPCRRGQLPRQHPEPDGLQRHARQPRDLRPREVRRQVPGRRHHHGRVLPGPGPPEQLRVLAHSIRPRPVPLRVPRRRTQDTEPIVKPVHLPTGARPRERPPTVWTMPPPHRHPEYRPMTTVPLHHASHASRLPCFYASARDAVRWSPGGSPPRNVGRLYRVRVPILARSARSSPSRGGCGRQLHDCLRRGTPPSVQIWC